MGRILQRYCFIFSNALGYTYLTFKVHVQQTRLILLLLLPSQNCLEVEAYFQPGYNLVKFMTRNREWPGWSNASGLIFLVS